MNISDCQNLSKFLIMNANKENTYSQAMGNISSFLNNLLQEHLKSTAIFILITLFWSKKALFTLVEFHHKIIPYLINRWKYAK
jgi:hypothetical protein